MANEHANELPQLFRRFAHMYRAGVLITWSSSSWFFNLQYVSTCYVSTFTGRFTHHAASSSTQYVVTMTRPICNNCAT